MKNESTARNLTVVTNNNLAPKKGGRVRRAPNMNTATWRKNRAGEIAREFGAEVGLKPSEILANKASLEIINKMIDEEIAEAKAKAMRIVEERLLACTTSTFVPPAATTTLPAPEKAAAKKVGVIQTKEEIEAGLALALKRAEEKDKAAAETNFTTPTQTDPLSGLGLFARRLVKKAAETNPLINGFVEALKAASWGQSITWEHFSASYGWLVWVLKNQPDADKAKVEALLSFIKEILRMECRTGQKATHEFYYNLIADRGLADKAFPLLMKDEVIQKETHKAEKKAQKKAKDAARQARKHAEAQRQSMEALANKGGKKKK